MKLLPFVMVILAVISYFATKNKPKGAAKPSEPLPAIENPTEAKNALRHSDWHVREAAVHALGQSADPNAITDLAAALNDDDDDVREAARQEIEKFGSAAVPALLNILSSGRFEAQALAAKALGVIGDRSATSGLIEALTDKSMWVRIPAAEALGAIGDKQAVSGLIAALSDDETVVQRSAADALRRIGTPEAQKALKLHSHT